MLYELRKSLASQSHPGINANFFRLVRNAVPYYISPKLNVPPPITIYWVINSVCNLRCKMCDVGMFNEEGTFFKNLRIDRKLHQIEISVFKSVVDQLAKTRPFMSLNSTEPTMYPHLAEAIEYCTAKKLGSAITTGGYALSKVADDIADAKLSRLNVSIDGPPDVHNMIRGKNDSFERTKEGLEIFVKRAQKNNYLPEITINCTITNLNAHKLNDFYDSIKDIPYTTLNFTLMWFLSPEMVEEHNNKFGDKFPVSVSCYDDFMNPYDVDIDDLWSQIQRLTKKPNVNFFGKKSQSWLQKFYKNPSDFMELNAKCMASWFFPQILADGRVGVHARCHTETFGNINDQPLMEIWNGPKMKEWRSFIRRQEKMPMCKRCDLVY